MKTIKNPFKPLLFIFFVFVIAACSSKSEEKHSSDNNELEGRITLSGAFALYPMATKWAEEFQKLHPQVKIDISAGGAGKGMADALAKHVNFGMVSRDITEAELQKGAWSIAVCKDAVIPTVSANNPYINELLKKGISQQTLTDIYINETVKTWGQLLKNGSKENLVVFTRSDASGAGEIWAKYLGKNQENLKGTGSFGDPGLAEAVKKNNLSIGYNNINYVYEFETKKPFEGLKALPIDLDNSGAIEENENFYGSLEEITKAIAQNKYPSPPARDLYLVSNGKPSDKVAIEFLKWIVTDGQKYVALSGYVNISEEKLKAELAKLK